MCRPIALVPVPDDVPARRATLAANMETALNALWDAGAGPGRPHRGGGRRRGRPAGDGAGGAAAGRRGDGGRYGCEAAPLVASLGARFARPEQAPGDADIVFHASATAAGLATAIKCAGFEGTVVEMSWYGDKPVERGARRRLPQPPPEARLLAGRPGLGEPPPALGLSPPHRGRHAAAGAAGARCAGRRGDRLRGRAARAAARARRPGCAGPRARHPLSARPEPQPERTPCTPSRCATAS